MATSGRSAWEKYFRGRGDIPTATKKHTQVFDVDIDSKKIDEVPAGTTIVYVKAKQYESKAVVKYVKNKKEIVGRIKFDDIAKPGVKASLAVSLKPQAFNVGETKYSFAIYRKIVSDSIAERKDLSGHLRTYLQLLFDYYSGGISSEQKIIKLFENVKDDLPLNDINKDFGEVLGPVAILNKGLLQSKKILINKGSTKIYVPLRPNEPLMDYGLIQGDKTFTISAKSGSTTNVVKPQDILSLLAKDPKKIKKWSNTKQYKLLQILSENSILIGPVKAIAEFYPNLISKSAAESFSAQGYDKKGFANFFSKIIYFKNNKNPTPNEIMYECEKILQDASKNGDLKLIEIFTDAIENQVIYVKFEINKKGLGDWSVTTSDDLKKVKDSRPVFLRSKNGYTRASDRMGIQI